MPTLNWIGKPAVINHHLEVPFHLLRDVPELGSGDPGSGNLIVEGDNLLALKALLPYYKGRVKCICIDPPYNTGNEGWAYNDNVNSPAIQKWLGETVGKEGETLDRHDRWLCMMYPRLKLLREFLSEDGSIWVALDDNEVHSLRYVMDEIFGGQNFVATVIWQKKYAVSNDHKTIAPMHDYIAVYQRVDKFRRNLLPRTEDNDKQYKFSDDKGVFRVSDYTCNKTADERPNLFYAIKNPNTGVEVWPKRTRVWGYSRDVFEKHQSDGLIWWGKEGKSGVPAFKRYKDSLRGGGGTVPPTFWSHEFADHTDGAKKELRDVFGTQASLDFFTPKPTRLIERILQIATNPGDLVLDSFAGSGTTGHAVLKMNANANANANVEAASRRLSVEASVEAASRRLSVEDASSVSSQAKRQDAASTASAKRQDAASTQQDAASTYFDPAAEVENLSGNLPHWRQKGVTYFVTFRTADSMPEEKLQGWLEEREAWMRAHPEPHDAETRAEYYRRFPERLQHWLDQGHGACLLARPGLKALVEDALRHFDGERYALGEFVVMPNHVHALVTPHEGHDLSGILHSWKSFTAKKINEAAGQTGVFWQKESFDHIIRSPQQLRRVEQYIRDNPGNVEAASRRLAVEDASSVLSVEDASSVLSESKRQDAASTTLRRFILVEMDEKIAPEITRERVKRVAEGYTNAKGEAVPGLGGGFRYVRLGEAVFDEHGRINEEKVRFADLARHVYFTETGEPLPKERVSAKTPLLGLHHGRAVYLLYNGILKDKSVDGGNVLTSETLAHLPAHDGPKVVYAAGCRFSKARLEREGITFKQTPYAIRTR